MAAPIISVEKLGKKYTISHQNGRPQGYRRLGEELVEAFWKPFQRKQPPSDDRPAREDFWALRDISFDVHQGEVVGIIGRNGAGKSTLLKILSRITEPTTGRVTLNGRVASLLEVGTGFHPELTGRENIFLNGAILGMSRTEIRRKFDEIVGFAEVEKFLDTPVKRYSSGMYVRLAFAVAAHLEPEILVVDEVLAVGDAEFQKKCLGKIGEVAKDGRTVLFVSHNMSAVLTLCGRGILLSQASLKLDESAHTCVQTYLQQQTGLESFERPRDSTATVRIVGGDVATEQRNSDVEILVKLEIWSDSARRASIDLRLSESTGNPVGFGSLGTLDSNQLIKLLPGKTVVKLSFPGSGLANGRYALSFDVTIPFREYLDRAERCLSFELERAAPAGNTCVISQRWGYGSVGIPLTLELVETDGVKAQCSEV